jgi:hypothetical protein
VSAIDHFFYTERDDKCKRGWKKVGMRYHLLRISPGIGHILLRKLERCYLLAAAATSHNDLVDSFRMSTVLAIVSSTNFYTTSIEKV